MEINWTNVLLAFIAIIPTTLAAYWSYKAKTSSAANTSTLNQVVTAQREAKIKQ